MKLALCVILFISVSKSHAQVTIEPLRDCIAFIIQYHHAQQQQEEKALETYKEKKWYTLLPQPGLGYNFMINKPMITVTLPDYVSYINRKKDLKYRILKTQITAQDRITADTVAFITGYKELELSIAFYEKELELIAQDSMLLKIKETANKSLQATTEDVLRLKISMLEKQFNHAKGIQAILSKAKSLESNLHRTFKISF